MVKKLVIVGIALFLVYLIYEAPAQAAELVKSTLSFIGDIFQRIVVFFRELAR
jgi:hypothetical protein